MEAKDFMALTKRQKQVLDFIAGFVDEHGYCPSYEEIARGLDLASLATVHKHISVLESKNYLKRGFNQSRSLEVAPKYLQEQRRPKTLPEIPLAGRIAAGLPVETIEQREMLNFADFAGSGTTYALEVRGNSMIEDHICDGDLILVEKVSRRSTETSWWPSSMEARRHLSASIGNRTTRCGCSRRTRRFADRGSGRGRADSGPVAGRVTKI